MHRIKRAIAIVFCVMLHNHARAQAGTGKLPAAPGPTSVSAPLPDTAPELAELKVQTDRKIAEAEAKVTAWKRAVSSLTATKSDVQALPPPDSGALQKLSEPPTTANLPTLRSAGQSVLNSVQAIYFRATPNQFGLNFNNNSAADPDVAAFESRWSSKVTALQNAQNLQQAYSAFQQFVVAGQTPPDVKDITEGLQALRPKATLDAFNQQKTNVISLLDGLIQEANASKEQADKEESSLQATSDAIVLKQGRAKTEITDLAIELGLPLFCVTVLLMLSIPIIVQSFSKAAGSSEQVRAIFSSGILVEIITVLLLTMTILILGLSSKIEGPVLGTLLGGISGYVLNRFRGKGSEGVKKKEDVVENENT